MEILDEIDGLTGRMDHQEVTDSQRVAHYAVDFIACAALTYLLLLLSLQTEVLRDLFDSALTLPLFYISVRWLYYILTEVSSGKTLGKVLTGSRVTSNGSQRNMSLGQALIRTTIRFIPLYPLLFIRGMKLHDRLSNTKVVKG